MFCPVTRSLSRVAGIVLVPLLALVAGCGADEGAGSGEQTDTQGACSYVDNGQEPARDVDPPPADPDPKAPEQATLRTSAGDIKVTLEPDRAPCAVNSFLSLAEQDYYDKSRCHRLTTYRIYVLQCGDPSATGDPASDGNGTPGYTFADEIVADDPRTQPCREVQSTTGPTEVCLHGPGLLAMANGGPDSNGGQFFFVYTRSAIEPKYTVLGRVDAAGLKVLRQVARAGVGKPGPRGATDGTPKTEVTITEVVVK